MKVTEKQLKSWLKSSLGKALECYLISQTGSGKYMVQLIVKQKASLLCDDINQKALHFSSLSQAKSYLARFGINKLELHLTDPYSEIGSLTSLDEKIKIPI